MIDIYSSMIRALSVATECARITRMPNAMTHYIIALASLQLKHFHNYYYDVLVPLPHYPPPPSLSRRALSTNAARELDVLGHDGDALGMDGAQVGVLKEPNEVGL